MRPFRISFSVLFVLFLGLTSAAQSPRVIPSNDNFANAITLVPGKGYSVSDIGAATNEGGEPGVSCGPGTIYNSVWYKIAPADEIELYLSTAGTQLYHPSGDSIDTVFAVFQGADLGSLTESECADDQGSLFSELFLTLNSPTPIYIAVGTYDNTDFLSPSVLKFTTRVTDIRFDIVNNGFETPVVAPWKIKNGTADDRICSNPSYPSYAGVCAFRFVGDPTGTTAKLVQVIPVSTAVQYRKNAAVMFYWKHRALDEPEIDGTKVILTALYSDGTLPTKRTFRLDNVASQASYTEDQTFVYLASSKLSSIKIEFRFNSSVGSMLFDDFELAYNATANTRDAGVLPLPAAAK